MFYGGETRTFSALLGEKASQSALLIALQQCHPCFSINARNHHLSMRDRIALVINPSSIFIDPL